MFGKPAFTEDKDKAPGVFQRGNIKISDEGRRINFASGTKIQTIIEEVLLETMFDLPSIENVEEVVVNKEVILGKSKPLLIYSKKSVKEEKIAN